ncbi:uncharacterized protein SETTUDRAFT_181077 [Exserohilum turcica Et28A]|uniref:Uncharacterized protein n=1 Tax=Exserohilum turcicum (strain 28A) TaxID=671987 RepID=R0ICN0_EXST2|nr:uncharacterized protein SETTUDRAFT_181077 [Exserohilum turcica Et28A]EOA82956.1 hypothetical protein SETTUDRAFT_181077 [Exserohilum turcica Et28A]
MTRRAGGCCGACLSCPVAALHRTAPHHTTPPPPPPPTNTSAPTPNTHGVVIDASTTPPLHHSHSTITITTTTTTTTKPPAARRSDGRSTLSGPERRAVCICICIHLHSALTLHPLCNSPTARCPRPAATHSSSPPTTTTATLGCIQQACRRLRANTAGGDTRLSMT